LNPGGSLIRLIIVPEGGGNSTASFRNELKAYLDGKRTVCTATQVLDATYIDIDIEVSVRALTGYGSSTIDTNVRAALMALLSPTYQNPDTGLYTGEIGRDITIADIYSALMGATGVEHCTLTTPTSDTLIASDEIAKPGTITITVVQP
jgi:uncharacterized phage protein gp47/JayE